MIDELYNDQGKYTLIPSALVEGGFSVFLGPQLISVDHRASSRVWEWTNQRKIFVANSSQVFELGIFSMPYVKTRLNEKVLFERLTKFVNYRMTWDKNDRYQEV